MNEIVCDIVRNTPNGAGGDNVPSRHRVPGTDIFILPQDLQEDKDGDRDPCTPGPNDDADLDHGRGAPARANPLDPLSNYLKEMISYTISYHVYTVNKSSRLI